MYPQCLFGSFVQVTLGRYHEGVTGDKYSCYHDIVRVCRELELKHSCLLAHFTACLLMLVDSLHWCHSDASFYLFLMVEHHTLST